MTTKVITAKEGMTLIRDTYKAYLDGVEPTTETAETIAFLVRNDIQLRDFMLGMPSEYHNDITTYGAFLELTINAVNDINKAYPLLTILSMFYFTAGESDLAKVAVNDVLETNGDYSLAKLLNRVFLSNAPVEMFSGMVGELHPKVVAGLEGEYGNTEVTE